MTWAMLRANKKDVEDEVLEMLSKPDEEAPTTTD
jgi:hypothetical protein